MTTQQNLVDFFDANAQTLRFLSQAFFKELTVEAIDSLEGAQWPESTGNDRLDAGYASVKRYFAFSAPDRRTQLAVEYARIFLAAGVYSKSVRTAVPYESVFTSEEHMMMAQSRDEVVAWFKEDGFAVDSSLHEPEDHVSFELEYLQVMSERASSFAADGNDKALLDNVARQRSFINAHLLNWLPLLAQAVRDYATLTFYTGLIDVAIGTLAQARDVMGGIRAEEGR